MHLRKKIDNKNTDNNMTYSALNERSKKISKPYLLKILNL